MVKIEGKYTLETQENIEEYLKAIGVGAVKRKVLGALKPDMEVSIEGGDTYVVKTITSIKTVVIKFKLGKEYEADPGTDILKKYVTVLENGDTLVTKEVDSPGNIATRKFSDTGMVFTSKCGDVTAVRTFKRA